MGRKTAESIPLRYFPLEDRINIVITRSVPGRVSFGLHTDSPIFYVPSFEVALDVARRYTNRTHYVIGGQSIYEEAFAHPDCCRLLISRIPYEYNCDRYLNMTGINGWWELYTIDYLGLAVDVYERPHRWYEDDYGDEYEDESSECDSVIIEI